VAAQWRRGFADPQANFLGIPAWLRLDALASELLGRLPADWEVAIECISQLVQGHQDSDLAVALCKNAGDDKLRQIAAAARRWPSR
jgi:hypothetical protein